MSTKLTYKVSMFIVHIVCILYTYIIYIYLFIMYSTAILTCLKPNSSIKSAKRTDETSQVQARMWSACTVDVVRERE